MSAEILRRAAAAERDEWGSDDTRRTYPKSSAVHLALADWLDEIAAGWAWDGEEPAVDWDGFPLTLAESLDSHALTVARAILAGAA